MMKNFENILKQEKKKDVNISWKKNYLEISKNPDNNFSQETVLVGHVTKLFNDKKIPLMNTEEYFHIQDILEEESQMDEERESKKKKLFEALIRELKNRNINYVFLPTNKKDNLKLFFDFFSNKALFHHAFEPEYIDKAYTANPKLAFDMLDDYEEEFKKKLEKKLVNPDDYQPPYFYLGADINSLAEINH